MQSRKISKTQRRKMTVFLRCLVISFVAWSLFAISSTYTYHQLATITYVNLPEGKAFLPLQSDVVTVKVRMTGWDIMVKRVRPDTAQVQVDINGLETRNFIVLSNQIGFIDKQFPAQYEAIGVSPDTLYFDFSRQTQKRVPVRVKYNLAYRQQYGIVGEIKTNPQFVTVTGPIDDVKEIEYIETDTIKGTAVDTDVRTVAYLNRQKKNNISIHPAFTEVSIPIGEMTEKVLELPIRVINDEKYTSVRILPSRVKVVMFVAIRDYNKWSTADFEAVVDMNAWSQNENTTLPVIITKSPPFTKVISVDPQNVDFFVRK